MNAVSRRDVLAMLLAAPAGARAFAEESGGGWTDLFDGRSLARWKPSDNEGTFSVVDGAGFGVTGGVIQVHGERSHLFYTGPVKGADFKNFEFSADVMTRPGANSGIYFHTAFQPTGFPVAGFEVQVANTFKGGQQEDWWSLYAVRNVAKQLEIRQQVVHDADCGACEAGGDPREPDALVDYEEPETPFRADLKLERVLNQGTFAPQGHDPGSTTYFQKYKSAATGRWADDAQGRRAGGGRALPRDDAAGRRELPGGGLPRSPEGRLVAGAGAGQFAAAGN